MEDLIKKGIVKLPVVADDHGIYIFDAEDRMLMQVRGWGRLQYLGTDEESIQMQVDIGKAFADAFNEKYKDLDITTCHRKNESEMPTCPDNCSTHG